MWEELFSVGNELLGMRYEVFTAGEELFHVWDELLIVATVFDRVYMYVCNDIPRDIPKRDPPCARQLL